jgi:hypothetical protein
MTVLVTKMPYIGRGENANQRLLAPSGVLVGFVTGNFRPVRCICRHKVFQADICRSSEVFWMGSKE